MSEPTAPRPEWALAYISQDWRHRGHVRKAYKAACDETEDAVELRHAALNKLRAYVRALESFDQPADPQ